MFVNLGAWHSCPPPPPGLIFCRVTESWYFSSWFSYIQMQYAMLYFPNICLKGSFTVWKRPESKLSNFQLLFVFCSKIRLFQQIDSLCLQCLDQINGNFWVSGLIYFGKITKKWNFFFSDIFRVFRRWYGWHRSSILF